MGNKVHVRRTSLKFTDELHKMYFYLQETNDPRFGDVQIYKHKFSESFIFSKAVWSKDTVKYRKTLNEKLLVYHENLLRLVGFHGSADDNLCGDFFKSTVYCEYYSYDLSREIVLRAESRGHFVEEELWLILDSCISALAHLEDRGFRTPLRITTSDVMLTKSGHVKLKDPEIFTDEEENSAQVDIGHCYNLNQESLGRLAQVVLEAAVLRSGYYPLSVSGQLDCDSFWQTLSLSYSEFLVSTLRRMVHRKVENFCALNKKLLPHRENIKNLRPLDAVTPYRDCYISLKMNESRIYLTEEVNKQFNISHLAVALEAETKNTKQKEQFNFKKKSRNMSEVFLSKEIFCLVRKSDAGKEKLEGRLSKVVRCSSAKSLKQKMERSLKSSDIPVDFSGDDGDETSSHVNELINL